MIRLLTTYYPESNPEREAEYEESLKRNAECPAIEEIVVFNECPDFPVKNSKFRIVPIKERPIYSQFFNYINNVASSEDINIVANSDIYFDKSIRALNYLNLQDVCLALSRWEDSGDGHLNLFDRCDSQDCWIFKGRIKDVEADFPLGVPRCDNRLAYELERAGYRVLNPAFSITTHHLHSGIREEYEAENLPDFVPPPYKYVWPHNLYGCFRTVVHNLRHREAAVGYRIDKRRLSQLIPWRVRRLV